MFIAALFIIARTWKQPRCPSLDKHLTKTLRQKTDDPQGHCNTTFINQDLKPPNFLSAVEIIKKMITVKEMSSQNHNEI